MDINAIILPEDAPDRRPTQTGLPTKKARKSRPTIASGKVNPSIASSPSKSPISGRAQSRLPKSNAPTAMESTDRLSHRPSVSRTASGMDTLADLASMQYQQVRRTKSGGLGKAKYTPPKPIPPRAPLSRPNSYTGSIGITETFKLPKLATYSGQVLSQEDLQAAQNATNDLAEHPFNYSSYLELIAILRRGLQSHIAGSDLRPPSKGQSYELLEELQQARQAMETHFALGEELWVERIEDLQMLASTVEECLEVVEICQKAITEEEVSIKIWLLYGNWILAMFVMAHPEAPTIEPSQAILSKPYSWSPDDKLVAAEVFTKQLILDVWKQGVEATKYHISESGSLWDVYMDIVLQDLDTNPSPELVQTIRSLFIARLHGPHSMWDSTFQRFSSFISTHDNAAYEDTMVTIKQSAALARKRYSVRAPFELKWQQAIEAGDSMAELLAIKEYVDWEMGLSRKKNFFNFDLLNAVFQRASIRLPRSTDLWDDYLTFLVDESLRDASAVSSLPVCDRACRHCPWSGTLWIHFIRGAEREKLPHEAVEHIKHRATSTGLLDDGGLEEILKVHTAWCGYLKRQAFQPHSTDEDVDVAEVGIRSAIEDMETLGQKKYGKAYQGDPQYRLERLYIKFLSQCRNFNSARFAWKGLIDRRGNSYEFWLAYAHWEMSMWAVGIQADQEVRPTPTEVTAVFRQALARSNIDWPEKMIESYLHHCEEQETIEELQVAVVQTKKAARLVAKRRENDLLASHMPAAQSFASARAPDAPGKRKRAESEVVEQETSKRRRSAEPESSQTDRAESAPLKRDRENTTVIVKNLPPATSMTRVRQFFRDCGTINNVDVARDGDTATATIEFDTIADTLTAETRNLKDFDGNEIEVQVGVGSTLFVTNFPPTADEEYIQTTFSPYGKIIDIRFPSLKYNTHRRFCYVQLSSAAEAANATALHGKSVGDGLKLSVQISDPNRKQDRHGALHDGREVYVSNIDWSATEEEVRAIFQKYGKIEKIRIPRNMAGKSKGMGFVVFTSQDEASAALDLNDTKFKSRILSVAISTPNPTKRQARAVITSAAASSPSDPATNLEGSALSPPNLERLGHPSRAEISARTIALLDLPDTVNDTRVRGLMTTYGSLSKLILRPDHQGAIIEFADAASAGKASLAIDGHEIAPGRRLRVGTVSELLGAAAEKRSSKAAAALIPQRQAPIKRPQATGRRGGLGARRHGVGLGFAKTVHGGDAVAAKPAPDTPPVNSISQPPDMGDGAINRPATAEAPAEAKSNADFKALFAKHASGDSALPSEQQSAN